ncbi:CinA family protein [Pseudomonas fluorescens]|uniref:Nicotinamide-nucleotide amidohydrolase PncC n=1 Tax=Pseudomonas fluorescens TaxID=294 RepID=A0A5E7AQD8_PSEFL|nr:CinA family protein [Pseudomonas fluorescens]VVN80815.1 Nicotinamide-nucleotide amidohydrolase PncC [Pseudomonas fluorescens]
MTCAEEAVEYLRQHSLLLTTAESCTAGKIVTLLAEVPGSGDLIESGYVVYSPAAKQRLLGVNPATIATFNLTSCEVAREMALGALRDSTATVAVATTGILGPDDVDGIAAGTVCFAWAFALSGESAVFTRKRRFCGSREEVQLWASEHALEQLPVFHRLARKGESG